MILTMIMINMNFQAWIRISTFPLRKDEASQENTNKKVIVSQKGYKIPTASMGAILTKLILNMYFWTL